MSSGFTVPQSGSVFTQDPAARRLPFVPAETALPQAITEAGEVVTDVASTKLRLDQIRKNKNDRARGAIALSTSMQEVNSLQSELMGKQFIEADGATQEYEKRFKEIEEAGAQGLEGEGLTAFKLRMIDNGSHVFRSISRHEEQQVRAGRIQAHQNYLEELKRTSSLNHNQPAYLESIENQVRAAVLEQDDFTNEIREVTDPTTGEITSVNIQQQSDNFEIANVMAGIYTDAILRTVELTPDDTVTLDELYEDATQWVLPQQAEEILQTRRTRQYEVQTAGVVDELMAELRAGYTNMTQGKEQIDALYPPITEAEDAEERSEENPLGKLATPVGPDPRNKLAKSLFDLQSRAWRSDVADDKAFADSQLVSDIDAVFSEPINAESRDERDRIQAERVSTASQMCRRGSSAAIRSSCAAQVNNYADRGVTRLVTGSKFQLAEVISEADTDPFGFVSRSHEEEFAGVFDEDQFSQITKKKAAVQNGTVRDNEWEPKLVPRLKNLLTTDSQLKEHGDRITDTVRKEMDAALKRKNNVPLDDQEMIDIINATLYRDRVSTFFGGEALISNGVVGVRALRGTGIRDIPDVPLAGGRIQGETGPTIEQTEFIEAFLDDPRTATFTFADWIAEYDLWLANGQPSELE